MRFIKAFIVMLVVATSFSVYASDKKIQIHAVNYPLSYFAQRIAGDAAQVYFLLPTDEDPAYADPDLEVILAFQRADLILLNGANYAKWIKKTSLPTSKMVDTSRKLKSKYIYTDQVTTHSHGGAGEHAHENLAFTTWLDFQMSIEQADSIKNALIKKLPSKKEQFERNFLSLKADLQSLDDDLKKLCKTKADIPILASHPVYQYYSRAYKLNIKSLHWEPDQILSKSDLNELKKILPDHPAQWLIWEGTPGAYTVELLDSMGISSIVFSPCSVPPEDGDFLTQMQQNIKNLQPIFID
ncbi:MAG: metal ABC transporter substrate-binding protein [Desulfobacterales bacterium]|nr:metal ABC transporter substrate-binding protein [Desulfobacterales bacterium]